MGRAQDVAAFADPKAVKSISDENSYWEVLSQQLELPAETTDRAAMFFEQFSVIATSFTDFGNKSLSEAIEIIDGAQDSLDNIWKLTSYEVYPEDRMRRFFAIVSAMLVDFIRSKLTSVNLFADDYSSVRDAIRDAYEVGERWLTLTETLTTKYWQGYEKHPWKGGKYQDQDIKTVADRLDEIKTVRSVHDQLTKLLTPEEQKELKMDQAFSAFANQKPLDTSAGALPGWKAAMRSYENATASIESKVATKLRKMLGGLSDSTYQVLKEFTKYKELVKRPVISRALATERETLLGNLITLVGTIRDEFETRSKQITSGAGTSNDRPQAGRNLPEIVNALVWVRQLMHKLDTTLSGAKHLVSDFPRYENFRVTSQRLLDDLSQYSDEQFQFWVSDMEDAMEDPDQPLLLQVNARLMEFDFADGTLKINFPERLVSLIREVRQLTALAFKIPRKVRTAAEQANKFYRPGMVLKGVANFYNTVFNQMIASQKGMLLEAAVAFEDVIKRPGGDRGGTITWNNAAQVEQYIEKVQAAAERIMKENTKLRKFHAIIGERVAGLLSIDLLKQQDKWRDTVRDVRTMMDNLERQGYQNLKPWRIHWDYQLYKALEYQYKLGLESLNENLNEMSVELQFKNGQLVFKPTFEEIQAKYYAVIKKFIKFPAHFDGVGNTDIFRQLGERNAASLTAVYRKAEDLFRRVAEEADTFQDWVALGTVNIEQYCDDNLKEVADWELNFRSLKARGREADKLPMHKTVDCIKISFAPVRNAIDDMMQRLSDALIGSLKKTMSADLRSADEFMDRSLELLKFKPNTPEEIGKATADYKSVSEQKMTIKPIIERCQKKNDLLRTVAGGGLWIDGYQEKYYQLEDALSAHSVMVKEQLDSMKAAVTTRQEDFSNKLLQFQNRWNENKPSKVAVQDRDAATAILLNLKEVRIEFDALVKVGEAIVTDCATFDMQPPDFVGVATINEDIKMYEEAWNMYSEFSAAVAQFSNEPWLTFRNKLFQFEDFNNAWNDKTRSMGRDAVSMYIRNELDTYRDLVPLLKFVRGDAFTLDHWGAFFRLVDMEKKPPNDITFGDIMAVGANIVGHAKQIKELHARASGEVTIREALQELKTWGQETEFQLADHVENGRSTMLVKDWKDLMTTVGDNQALLASLKDSPYFRPFAEEVLGWEAKLINLQEYLYTLLGIQRKWVYLEPILTRGNLPSEQQRFNKVDTEFRAMMQYVESNKRVVYLVDYPGIKETLPMLADQLDRCQKALSEYLEDKRSRFSRFYFIGDDDLLEILGQATNPTVIQSHLKKLFQGIHKVAFTEDKKKITAMHSSLGEVVPLSTPVTITEKVEEWLTKLADEMRVTLKGLLVKCIEQSDIKYFPSQVLQIAEQVNFTTKCEQALLKGTLKQLAQELRDQLAKYTSYESGNDVIIYTKIKALVLDIIHYMDVVDYLKDWEKDKLDSWAWQKQLRFYMEGGVCKVKMCDTYFDYTYEYQGNAPKLVHTPLTDKCYLTLTQGIFNGYGGNPYGPAGTGKTESVKALGQLLGRQVLVFNCDEGIDFKSMGRIFTGIIKCGAWGCFDEFNRLDEEVLSAVSQQIQVIQSALQHREKSMTLLGANVDVDLNSGIFVTLNPAGKGYGARSKLPDNLKQLFRAVAMSVPDLFQIAEVILYSEGFKFAKELGKKLVNVFLLCRQILSAQQHYDWGLRALKTILTVGGQILQNEKKQNSKIDQYTEARIVVQAMNINTLSKLTYLDSLRFNALREDVFPGLKKEDLEKSLYDELEKCIKEALTEMKLDHMPSQIRKILQYYEACNQRMGVGIVGPGGCGKSTLWKVLREALKKMKRRLVIHTINPKAIPRQQLLGHMDQDTREWFDGVLTEASRAVVKEPSDTHSWIICDGDIDPAWIESLNSVLDDNRLLTMPNGERIQFGANVNFIFETNNLKFASPATVSRMGMIFLSDEDMEIKYLVNSWLRHRPAEEQARLQPWIDGYFFRSIEWVIKEDALQVDTTQAGIVTCGLSLLKGCNSKGEFAVSLIRGLGGNLDPERRANFAREVFGWTGEKPVDLRRPLACFYDAKLLSYRAYENDSGVSFLKSDLASEPIVPTADVRMNADVIMPWLNQGDPFILVGPEGSGKSMLMRFCFGQLRATSICTVHCSSQTSAKHVIQKLIQSCGVFSGAQGRVLRPKEGDRLVLYLKDVNLPKPDPYETIQLVSFLQQLLTYNGYFDDNLEWLSLERIQIVCSMNPPSTTGRYPLTTRFTSLMRIHYLAYPSRDQLQLIYSTYLDAALPNLPANSAFSSKQNRAKLANSMLDLYEQVKSKFSVDDYSHYLFTPRDLTKWVLGFLRYDQSNIDLLEVWNNEARRIFRDRLVNQESKERFDRVLDNINKTQWSMDFKAADVFFTTIGSDAVDEKTKQRLLRKTNANDLKEVVTKGLTVFERDVKELHILLFNDILDHICRVDRVLNQKGGSILMVGKAGVGRRSALELAAHMLNIPLFTPAVSRNYAEKNFRADLKTILQHAGVEGTPQILLLEDHQFVKPEFIELMNSLLSSGEVPGLYTPEELEPLLQPLKDELSEQGFFGTPFQFFVERVKQNLHVVISMDPNSDDFTSYTESNPALFTKCDIQWWEGWSPDAMKILPFLLLRDLMNDMPNKDHITKGLLQIHESAAARFRATPRQYIALLHTYRQVYESKRHGLEEQQRRLRNGLDKLGDAAVLVDQLSVDANAKKALVAAKQEQANKALVEITKSMEGANDQRKEITTLNASLAQEKVVLETRKDDIEYKLANVQPILDAAREAVGGISPAHLTELKSMAKPPQAVADVLSGVLRLLGTTDTSWNAMKAFLGSRGVKENILGLDARKITPEIRNAVQAILTEKAKSFEKSNIEKVSKAAAPLATWVSAIIQYSTILDSVGPMEKELANLAKKMAVSEKKVAKLSEELRVVDEKVAKLRDEFQICTTECAVLKVELDRAEGILESAQSLFGKLGGEKQRWDQTVNEISKNLQLLPASALMAAGFVTYLGHTPEDLRRQMLSEWAAMLAVPDWVFTRFMSTESELLTFKAQGLPGDDLSMENALVIQATRPVPFIIDPSTLVSKWLRTYLSSLDEKRSIEVTTQEDERFANTLELAVRFGKTLVVQEIDRIHPVLVPLLRKDLVRHGPRWMVQVGDKAIDYHEDFRLYLVTRNPQPILPPDVSALIAVVNFSITRSGLEGQLLSVTIKSEKPELEEKKSKLLLSEEENKVQLAHLEASLLKALAASEGNILENKALLDSLNETKSRSIIIAEALRESTELQLSIDKERNAFKKIATNGSALYFLMLDLRKVNHMYQFSLPVFSKLFGTALSEDKGASGNTVEARVNAVCDRMMKLVFEYVSRSLFKADRLMFGLHLVHIMFPKHYQENEWDLFVGKIVAVGDVKAVAGFPQWAAVDRKAAFALLQANFPKVIDNLSLKDADSWVPWAKSPTCELEFPPKYSKGNRVTPFQRILLLQALRPDRLESALTAFVCELVGVSSLSPPPLNLQKVHQKESTTSEPILMITSPGADPSMEIEEFAHKMVGKDCFHQVAMGQGQQEAALQALRKGFQEGHWVLLKNVHLAISWLPTLEKELTAMQAKDEFRLFLTSEPHQKFSAILLQSSLKITYEAPPGVKKNLLRTFELWNEYFNVNPSILRSQSLFALAWFHAIIQERRTFIPQGWSKFYEFSIADLRASAEIIDAATRSGNPDWNVVHGLLENAIYGGRVDNEYDVRVLRSYLQLYFNNDVLGKTPKNKLDRNLTLPVVTEHQAFVELVQKMSDSDNPGMFHLPGNIDRSLQRANSALVVAQLKVLAASAGEGSRFNREVWAAQLAPILALWTKLVGADAKILSTTVSQKKDNASPIDVFVVNEQQKGLDLIRKVHSILQQINKVTSGSALLTPDLLKIGSALVKGQLPDAWLDEWPGPEDVYAWLGGLISRAQALAGWSEKANAGTLMRGAIDLNEIYRPDAFLNALRQQTARLAGCALDTLKLVSSPDQKLLSNCKLPVDITGLLLQGAAFDSGKLSEAFADAATVVPIPHYYIGWIPQDLPDPHKGDNCINAPLYLSGKRDKFICEIGLPCQGDRVKWILAGVALFLTETE
eukprot:TRINITY_DN91_c0_g1_i1.p1 TRINITY_DN91_c0_g1~~TRINITY_DN91_c0_g1_i1.p1  ORF type:complete len:4098 (+),score=2051.07 TRINITY_DN91_c0_g1_i1:208-12501(+)